jgi:hypothetical protein
MVVHGRVTRAGGRPLVDVLVVAFDRDLRSRQELGRAHTDAGGNYRITYPQARFARAEKGSADLLLQVMRGEDVLHESPIVFNAGPAAEVDLAVDGEHAASEYEELLDELKGLLGDHDLAGLVQDEEHDDISFLAGETGREEPHITFAVTAHRLQKQTRIAPAALYGLFRSGLPADLPGLLAAERDLCRQGLESALTRNIVPAALRNQVDEIMRRLEELRTELATAPSGDASRPALADILEVAGTKPAVRTAFITRYLRHDGPIAQFWADVRNDAELGGHADDFERTLRFSALSGNHLPLVRRLQQDSQQPRQLASFTEDTWLGLIEGPNGTGVPASITGSDEHERARTYARRMRNAVEDAFPTAVVTAQLVAEAAPQNAGMIAFLQQNESFDIVADRLPKFLADNPGALAGVPKKDQTVRDLGRLQRVYRCAPRYEQATVLIAAKLDSALAIARIGRHAFVRTYEASLGGPAEALGVFDRAARTSARALHLLAEFGAPFNQDALAVVAARAGQPPSEVPDWETLFGSLDMCACEHCRSVYSPAAYFVDVLNFLHEQGTAGTVLLGRRPDLGEIELTCENTNTPLPYVDLVNEVLEAAVAPLPPFAAFDLPAGAVASLDRRRITPTIAHKFDPVLAPSVRVTVQERGERWTIDDQVASYAVHLDGGRPRVWRRGLQTRGTAQELAANPEYLLPGAYEELRSAVFPWSMPFDLWAATVRGYLAQLRVDRAALMQVLLGRMAGPSSSAALAIAAERLGLTPQDRRIITAEPLTPARGLAEFWGQPAGTPVAFASVRALLDRTGLTYQGLLDLLTTRFVNPDGQLILRSTNNEDPASCDPAKLEITGLDDAALDRIHRFERLRARLGWTAADLDLAVSSLRGRLDGTLIRRLAHVQVLRKRMRLDLDQVLALWSRISIAGEASLYRRLFQNPAVLSPVDPAFALAGNELVDPTQPIAGHAATIQAALRIDAAALDAAITRTTSDRLDLANLSAIHRVTILARAAGLSVPDTVRLLDLAHVDPFDIARPEETVGFLDLADLLRAAGFSVAQLDHLLGHAPLGPGAEAAADSVITLRLDELRSGLRTIAAEHADVTADPTGELVRAALSLLLAPPDVDRAMSLLGGTWDDGVAATAFATTHFVPFPAMADAVARLVGPNPTLAAGEPRFRYVGDALRPHLRRRLSEQYVIQTLGTGLGLDVAVVARILGAGIDDLLAPVLVQEDPELPITPADLPVQFATLRRLDKIALIARTLSFTATQLGWVFDRGPAAGWYDLTKLPVAPTASTAADFAAFVRLVGLSRLGAALPAGETVLDGVFTRAADPSATRADVVSFLDEQLGWAREDIEFLLGPQVLDVGASAAAFGDERVVARLLECFGPIRLLGVSARQVREWATPELDADAAHAAVHAVKAKYGDDEWLTLAPPLRDRLREQQRAALVAYLVGNGPWADANALYAHFLIDVEMSPCALTSRIKQAAAAAQLFAQRCLMNLEPAVQGATADHEDWARWRWMKTYRVWEANRKVFLYPENWVQPELRDDKSTFFQEFEDEIAQADVTPALVEDAFVRYLEKLDDVAWLDVVAEYHEQEIDPISGVLVYDVLHVIARSFTSPRRYYYRRRHDGARWTAWELINLDIVGDQIVAVVWNRRLHLCWLTFTEQTEEAPITMPAANATMDEPTRYWKIQLAWSEYKRGRWVAKRLSEEWVRGEKFSWRDVLPPQQAFTCKAIVRDDGMLIRVHAYRGLIYPWPLAQFRFNGCGSAPLVEQLAWEFGPNPPVVLADGTLMEGMQLVESAEGRPDTGDRLVLQAGDFPTTGVSELWFILAKERITTLERTPGWFRLLTPAQDEQFTSQRPFFYADERRSYHVIPRDRRIPDIHLPEQDHVDPGSLDGELAPLRPVRLAGRFRTSKRYRFEAFSHPYVCSFVRDLNRDGVDGLLTRANQKDLRDEGFAAVYGPRQVVVPPYPPDEVDFSYRGAYSLYNWELFFHAPLLVADRLTRNQQFEAAQAWFHYIFDPTDAGGGKVPERYWRTLPFFEAAQSGADRVRIDELLRRIAEQDPDPEADAMVQDWLEHPFQPHAVARLRPGAYQKAVVMRYVDNLLQWGDHLFATDRGEAINEATQLYVLAAEILGRRPEQVPPRATTDTHTYTSLQARLVDFSNALVDIESFVPPSAPATTMTGEQPGLTLPPMLYFCVPGNDVLLAYWDRIADRLSKIRTCRNIAGQRRPQPLWDPPLDPALLVQAQAAGVDIGTVLSDTHAPAPHHRYAVLAQKAAQLCGDLKGLGAALLSAMEKRDAEELALLRSTHEIGVLKATLAIRERQVEEAAHTLEGLRRTRELAQLRNDFYRTRAFMSPLEMVSEVLAGASMTIGVLQAGAELEAMTAYVGPDVKVGAPTTAGLTFGGTNLGASGQMLATKFRTAAALLSSMSVMVATRAGYQRRADDWKLQEESAAKEIEQIDQQITAAEIRLAISEREVTLHEQQTENASALDELMRTKYTNRELYDWTVGQISAIYFQSYRLAYELAQRAERAFRRELGLQESSFVQFGHWDSLKQGLVAGERLHLDLQRMDSAYLDQRSREYELMRHVSLAQLDPTALVLLRQTGECFLSLPEALFDLDCPGHYLRRILSVSLSIPCVTGPYTSVNCTLRQLKSSIRYSSEPGGQYARQQPDDPRFGDTVGTAESIVTSTGVTDGGVFELNARDERYLPFEGSGVISDWHLALPGEFRQFDYDTIADVVLHIQYTARDGGPELRTRALTELIALVNDMVLAEGREGLALLLSARRDLSHEWPRFLNPPAGVSDQTLTIDLSQNRFPHLFTGRQLRIDKVDIYVSVNAEFSRIVTDQNLKITLAQGATASTTPLRLSDANGLLHAEWTDGNGSLGDWTLAAWLDNGAGHEHLDIGALADASIVFRYRLI